MNLAEPRSRKAATLNNIGVTLHNAGRSADAEKFYIRAVSLEPHYAVAFSNLGAAQAALGRHHAAVASCREAIALAGASAEASNNLGCSLHALNQDEEALEAFKTALAADPRHAAAGVSLVRLLKLGGRDDEALAHCRVMAGWERIDPRTSMFLGRFLREAGLFEDARSIYERCVREHGLFAGAYAGLASVQQELGDVAGADAWLRRAIALSPKTPAYYRGLALNAPLDADDPCFSELERLNDDLPEMNDAEKIELHFALGKALADAGRKDESFEHLLAGNKLRRRRTTYDEATELARFGDIEAVFDRSLMSRAPPYRSDTTLPVFIVGMPRSGSTLIEQILTSHPQVVAGGEMRELERAVDEAAKAKGASSLPGLVRWWAGDDLRRVAERYIGHLEKVRAGSEKEDGQRVTDKRLDNIFFVGLIRLLFPRARIIHAVRDPIDTCLSCFSLLFDQTVFSYDLAELGRRYRAYRGLMDHWGRVLPAGSILDVRYEDVVADAETQARRIVSHCGLEWDPACLEFYKNRRPVQTASVVQVRQPIYTTSVGRWRPDAEALRPLLDALDS